MKVKTDMNATEDFFEVVTAGHIIAVTLHACLFVSLTIWSRISGVNRAKNVVAGSPKGMDGPTGSENSRMLTVQGVSDHSASSWLLSLPTAYPP